MSELLENAVKSSAQPLPISNPAVQSSDTRKRPVSHVGPQREPYSPMLSYTAEPVVACLIVCLFLFYILPLGMRSHLNNPSQVIPSIIHTYIHISQKIILSAFHIYLSTKGPPCPYKNTCVLIWAHIRKSAYAESKLQENFYRDRTTRRDYHCYFNQENKTKWVKWLYYYYIYKIWVTFYLHLLTLCVCVHVWGWCTFI